MIGAIALVVVVVALLAVKLVDGSGSSSGGAGLTSAPGHGTAPLSSAQLAQFERDATELDKANQAATTGFAGVGDSPTPQQLDPIASTYQSALDLYQSQLHQIGWPASMQSAITLDTAQLQALVAYLESSNVVKPGLGGAWLTLLHNRAGLAQSADNRVRQDLGFTGTTTFP